MSGRAKGNEDPVMARCGGVLRGVTRLLLVALAVVVPACTGSGQDADRPKAALPQYSPEAATLFDDAFAPALFGFDAEVRVLARDMKLRERTRLADFIVPARVETVSRVGGVARQGSYEVTLAPSGAALVGTYEGGPVVVNVPTTNPSYVWIEGAGANWVGSRLLLFGRYYAGAGAAPLLHFRCEPDTAEFRSVVARNAALRLLR